MSPSRTIIVPLAWLKSGGPFDLKSKTSSTDRDCCGSVVECLTLDQGAAGLSLTGVTELCP